jgi:type II secretory pathway predicted ATPase ExeA
MEIAHDYRDIAVIVWDVGTGKTTATRLYETESHAALVVYILSWYYPTKAFSRNCPGSGGISKGVEGGTD